MPRAVLSILPLYIPVLWVAYSANRKMNLSKRLSEEYAHKEALAKSYASYKEQIESLDSDDKSMQKIFIMKAVDAIAYNASETLDGKHGDNHPMHGIVEKITDAVSQINKLVKEK